MMRLRSTSFFVVLFTIGLLNAHWASGQQSITTEVGFLEVQTEVGESSFSAQVETNSVAKDLVILRLTLRTDGGEAPPPSIRLKWSMPSRNVAGYWTTSSYFRKELHADWWPSRVTARLASNAPVLTLLGRDDTNRLTVATSDALNTSTVYSGVREEDGRIYGGVNLFDEPHKAVDRYTIDIRFDLRDVPFYTSLGDVATWWEVFPEMTPAKVPEIARMPMYSTWYSYHQSVSFDALVKEVEAARELGFKAIIVDDGWQTLDSNRGYAYTGDWKPERLPRMSELVQAIHDRGMKFLLWYAVPLVGEKSEVFEKFGGKFLRYWDGQGAYELDPRYPEVREHLIQTYIDAVEDWGVDGFKFDFMGRFIANEKTVLTAEDGRDFASVNAATDKLMTDIMSSLEETLPDIMVEFRQPYIGPLMRKYGNMFRAGDAPNAVVANRVRTTDLRLLSGSTAVHSDMIMWHYDEPVEQAALQYNNILFSVPQISVRLADIPADHKKMVTFYTDYWINNRDVLLDGEFVAHSPMLNYPVLEGRTDDKWIIGLYDDRVVTLGPEAAGKEIDIVNGKPGTAVVLRCAEGMGDYSADVVDATGERNSSGVVSLEPGLHEFTVPVSGILELVPVR